MKKIFIVNGSPRKTWNTAKMCASFAEGVKSKGVEVEIINLYDINFSGCRSCFGCKLVDGKSFSRCAYQDDLQPILDKIVQADGLVLASPIYFGEVTGMMRCFIERLMFPFFQYAAGFPSTAPKKFPTAVIYTMNRPEDDANQMYPPMFGNFEWAIGTVFSAPERICAYDTCQFTDYSKYAASCFDPEHKKNRQEKQLPRDLENAFEQGIKMAEKVLNA